MFLKTVFTSIQFTNVLKITMEHCIHLFENIFQLIPLWKSSPFNQTFPTYLMKLFGNIAAQVLAWLRVIQIRLRRLGHIQPFMILVVVIFIIFLIFGQIQLYFGHVQNLTFVVVKFRSSSNVKVCCCQLFLVKF